MPGRPLLHLQINDLRADQHASEHAQTGATDTSSPDLENAALTQIKARSACSVQFCSGTVPEAERKLCAGTSAQ